MPCFWPARSAVACSSKRNFSLDPAGKYVFSSNQDTENVVVLRIDHATGRLTQTGVQVPLANPGSVAFVRK